MDSTLVQLEDIRDVPPQRQPQSDVDRRSTQTIPTMAMKDGLRRWNEHSQSWLLKNEPMWKAVATGTLSDIKETTQKLVDVEEGGERKFVKGRYERGGEGETILHIAILFQRPYSIVKWIVEAFPSLVNEEYLGERYEGETALHLAVVQAKDHDPSDDNVQSIIRLLVDTGANPNLSRAIGSEFGMKDHGPLRNYGQTVLHFAVISNKPKISEYLVLRARADITAVDNLSGDNVLHLLARSKGIDATSFIAMFRFFKNTQEDLLDQPNFDGKTPLALGFAEKNVFMLDAMKEILWEFDRVSRYRVPLNELDPLLAQDIETTTEPTKRPRRKSLFNSKTIGQQSLIELAIENKDKDMLNHPIIDTLLAYKWKLYAQYFFIARFALALVLVIGLFTPAIAMQPSTFQQRCTYDSNDIVRLVWEMMTLAAGVGLFWISANDSNHKWNRMENWLRSTFGLSIFLIPIIRAIGSFSGPGAASTALAIESFVIGVAAILGWIYLVNFAKGSDRIGPLVEIVFQIVSKDFIEWLFIYIPLSIGFGTALFAQLQNVTGGAEIWQSLPDAVMSAIRFQFQEESYTDFQAGTLPWWSVTLFVVYGFLATLLLSNILISKLVNTFERINEDSQRVWKMDLARLILSIDLQLTAAQKQRYAEHIGFSLTEGENDAINASDRRYIQFTERREQDANGKTFQKVLQISVSKSNHRGRHDDYVVKKDKDLKHFRGVALEWEALLVFWGLKQDKSGVQLKQD
ncbi:hypothetical protein HDU79_009389 [Rhizoclosmatium sp. JEL0117]|nr:hypothetical protein HDU79_009389 [Rhizoclosmatium sp. JEL0117]